MFNSSAPQVVKESPTTSANNQSDIITQKEVFDWLMSQGSELTQKISWDNIEQATIKKQYVVKIPLSDTSALFLLKKNKTINAYAYKWQTQKTTSDLYTGSTIAFNLQTGFIYRVGYNKGVIINTAVYKSTQNTNPIISGTNDQKSSQHQIQQLKINDLYLSDLLCITLGYAFEPGYDCRLGAFLVVFEDGGYNAENPPQSVPQGYNWSYNTAYYQQSNGNTQPLTEDMIGSLGGGVFWIRPPADPENDNNGCQVVNEGIRQKTVNGIKNAQILKNQNTGGCPQWQAYPFDFSDLISADALENAVPLDDNSKPHIDVQKYFNCFNDGASGTYKLTLYINQPKPGTNNQFELSGTGPAVVFVNGAVFTTPTGLNFDVGHAFIGFEKHETNGTVINQTLGFYPANGAPYGDGEVKDDAGHPYNISYTITVTEAQFNSAINSASNDDANTNYYVKNYNCSDAALKWVDAAGASISSVPRGVFNNTPGDLGQAIKQRTGAQNYQSQATAPASHGPCN